MQDDAITTEDENEKASPVSPIGDIEVATAVCRHTPKFSHITMLNVSHIYVSCPSYTIIVPLLLQ